MFVRHEEEVRPCLTKYWNIDTYYSPSYSQDSEILGQLELTIFGVTIDDKLTFSYHIKDINERASQRVGVLLRLRNLIPCSAKLQLYKSAILPHLTYCDTIWHFCQSSDRRKLFFSNNTTFIGTNLKMLYNKSH